MSKRLLVTAPALITVAGKRYQLDNDYVGKTLVLPDHEVEQILRGSAQESFKVIPGAVEGTPISIHAIGAPTVKRPPSSPTPALSQHSGWATPYAAGTIADPVDLLAAPIPTPTPAPEVVIPVAVVEPAPVVVPEAPVAAAPSFESLNLEPDSHWSKVKARLSDLAEVEPLDLEAVLFIQENFDYEVIQRECERILV